MQEQSHFSLRVPQEVADASALFSLGVPLKKGQYFLQQSLQCCRSDGKDVDAALYPLAFWPDNSIKWLRIVGETDTTGLDLATFSIEQIQSSAAQANPRSIEVSSNTEHIALSMANISIHLSKHDLLSGALTIDGQCFELAMRYQFEPPFSTLTCRLKDWQYTPYFSPDNNCTAKYSELALQYEMLTENSALQPLEVHCCLAFYDHFGHAELTTTLLNPNPAIHDGGTWDLGEDASVLINRFDVILSSTGSETTLAPTPAHEKQTITSSSRLWQRSSVGENWNSPNHLNRNRTLSVVARSSAIEINNQSSDAPIRLQPTGTLANQQRNLRLEPVNFWQNFPTAFSAKPGELCWHLFYPEPSELVELQPGEQKTHCAILQLSSSPIRYVKAEPVITPQWVTACDVVPWFSEDMRQDPLHTTVQLGVQGVNSFTAKREHIDEYGWRHFGDLYADHETAEHTGNDLFPSHYNNQYDPLYGFLRQWLLTGDPAWKTLADDLAHHIIDIDIYHCETDKPEYNQGLFWHTDHYLPAETATHRTYSKHHKSDAYQDHAGGGGPGGQHCYTSGLQLYYCLTGNKKAKESVYDLTHWIRTVYEGDNTLFGLLLQFKNRYRKDLKDIASGSYPFDRGTANYMIALLDSFELNVNIELLDQVAFIIRQTLDPNDDISGVRDLENVEECWFYTVFLQAICRYLITQASVEKNANYQYAKACLIHYAKWMAQHEYPYLQKPEILEYPNQTWTAQDLRKVQVLLVAANHVDSDTAQTLMQAANQLKRYIVNALQHSEERHYTRILALLMQNYWRPPSTQNNKEIANKPFEETPRTTGWKNECMRVLKHFSLRNEWCQLQKRIPQLRGKL